MASETTEQPSVVLRDEHKQILRVIGVLSRLVSRSRNAGEFESGLCGRCVEFFRYFADACHHAKEEDLLFPVLESRGIPREGGPIGVMLYEHRVARQLTQQMSDALDATAKNEPGAVDRFHSAALQYVDLLTRHIFKEDNVLFPMGDRVMTAEDQSALCGRFCDAGCRSFGGKSREELRTIADELEAQVPEGT